MNAFRNYIQVLRAISIVSVVLFHFYNTFPKGYLGVDLFFIISGFLVGGKIVEDVKNSTFSFSFFKRRLMRIIPNQIFYISLLLLIIFFSNYPEEISIPIYLEITKATLLISNIHYWSLSGYFNQDNIYKPLLHLWSLAIEEQFYILFPIFILIANRINKKINFYLLLLFLISFALNFTTIGNNAKFYLLPFRIWEFLIGTLIYSLGNRSLIILLLTLPFTIITSNPYDSCIVIILGIGFFFLEKNRLLIEPYLNNKKIQFIGNISYSIYLSHWIIFFLLNSHFIGTNKFVLFTVYTILTFGLSTFTYFFIERKIRFAHTTKKIKLLIPLIIIFLINFLSKSGIHFQKKFFLDNTEFYTYNKLQQQKKKHFFSDTVYQLNSQGSQLNMRRYICNKSKPTLLIWGDSHCDNLQFSVRNLSCNIVVISTPGCPPLWNTFRKEPKGGNNCNCETQEDRQLTKKIITSIDFDVIILVSRWNIYLDGWKKNGILQKNTHFIFDSTKAQKGYVERIDLFKRSLIETTKFFTEKNKSVILINQFPDIADHGDAKTLFWKQKYTVNYKKSKSVLTIDSIFQQIKNPKIKTLDLSSFFLNNKGDITVWESKSNSLVFFDDNHLSFKSGFRLGNRLLDSICVRGLTK